MSDKKKVLGKGKLKQKDPPLIKKLELPKYAMENLVSDEYNIKKFKSPKILTTQANSEPIKNSITPTPLSTAKRRFFNKRISETPKLSKDGSESKRKSLQNLHENNEMFLRSLGTKLNKYKQKNCELEEKLKNMESRFRLEEYSLRGEIEKLTFDLKKQKLESTEREAALHQEILRLRRENEENKVSYKFQISQVFSLIDSHLDSATKEKIESLFNDFTIKSDEIGNHDPNILVQISPTNCTASFNNMPNELMSSREIIKSSLVQAIVLYDYTPASQGELRLKSGDRIVILNSDENNGWWLGRIGDKIGMFPRNCVMLD